ncbi:hypothetical protein CDL12_19549 [Handroanthus impetiginosus]|uniref:UVR domain-containing protein n=1 Tax=Handroanthus impetiginosus TaxID=429701 RepID=A0A2G9GRN5_9LAMI|nr:hypothetical protein CDL12_19549 [Handroanthus impetiginosus]
MHCLHLKVATNLNSLSSPSRFSSSIVRNCNLRLNRIVACSGSTSGQSSGSGSGSDLGPVPGSSLSRTETYAMLKQQLEVAAKSEDYKEAARIRDSLKLFEEEEPVLRLQRLLKEAIAEERFEDAAKYRDELKEIAPHCLLKCSSDATTLV